MLGMTEGQKTEQIAKKSPVQDITSIERRIFSTFGDVASALGYSPIHGQIVAILVMREKELSLQDVAKELGYSVSMVSLSLDMLELMGTIRKIKKTGDRKLYIELNGDLLDTLKRTITMKVTKSISSTLHEFEQGKEKLKGIEGEKSTQALKTLESLEGQIKRIKTYVDMLSSIKLPDH